MSFFKEALAEVVGRYGSMLDQVVIVLPDQNAVPAFRFEAAEYAQELGRPLLLPGLSTLHELALQITSARIPTAANAFDRASLLLSWGGWHLVRPNV